MTILPNRILSEELDEMSSLMNGPNYSPSLVVCAVAHELDAKPASIVEFCFPGAGVDKIELIEDKGVALQCVEGRLRFRVDDTYPELDSNRFVELLSLLLSKFGTSYDQAQDVYAFVLQDKGHPLLPVYWELGILFRSPKQSEIWLGAAGS